MSDATLTCYWFRFFLLFSSPLIPISVFGMPYLIIVYMPYTSHLLSQFPSPYLLVLWQVLFLSSSSADACLQCTVINVRTNIFFIACWRISNNVRSQIFSAVTNVYKRKQVSNIYLDRIEKKTHYFEDQWNEACVLLCAYLTYIYVDCIIYESMKERERAVWF